MLLVDGHVPSAFVSRTAAAERRWIRLACAIKLHHLLLFFLILQRQTLIVTSRDCALSPDDAEARLAREHGKEHFRHFQISKKQRIHSQVRGNNPIVGRKAHASPRCLLIIDLGVRGGGNSGLRISPGASASSFDRLRHPATFIILIGVLCLGNTKIFSS